MVSVSESAQSTCAWVELHRSLSFESGVLERIWVWVWVWLGGVHLVEGLEVGFLSGTHHEMLLVEAQAQGELLLDGARVKVCKVLGVVDRGHCLELAAGRLATLAGSRAPPIGRVERQLERAGSSGRLQGLAPTSIPMTAEEGVQLILDD